MEKIVNSKSIIIIFCFHIILLLNSTSAVDFIFNGFDSSDVSLYGNATIESGILTLTNETNFSIGRSLYPSRIQTKDPNSSIVLPFSTSFIFSIAPFPNRLPGHGFVFLFVPFTGINGSSSSQQLGFLNRTNDGNPNNHMFGVEFDIFENTESVDFYGNHVGINVNSLRSIAANEAGYWVNDNTFRQLELGNGRNYQVWIDYDGSQISVVMAPVGIRRPVRSLLFIPLNLSQVFEDEMYVGFTASTGALVSSHKILGWSFSNYNSSLSQDLVTRGLPSFELPRTPIRRSVGFVVGLTFGLFFLVVSCAALSWFFYIPWFRRRKLKRPRKNGDLLLLDLGNSNIENTNINDKFSEEEKDFELPMFSFSSISTATNKFSPSDKLGEGGFGPVYKGSLLNGQSVAVKRLSKMSGQGMEELRNEATLIAKLQHRNLVRLLGCCIEKNEKILVYEYMPNKSLDSFLFDDNSKGVLDWSTRVRIIDGITQGLLYLHEYSRLRIVHRDLKASNILLDGDMNPKISDFGMARIFDGNVMHADTNRIVGTYGYMSPEYAMGGRFSVKSDVFAFGVLLLEILSGQKNTGFHDSAFFSLLGYAWNLWENDRALELIDPSLKPPNSSSMPLRYVHIGLLCVEESPDDRPTISQVLAMLSNEQTSLVSPKRPAFTTTKPVVYANSAVDKLKTSSIIDLSTSILEPR